MSSTSAAISFDRPTPSALIVFGALLRRDLTVSRRNIVTVLVSVALQPLMLTIVFGVLLPSMGFVGDAYKAALLPGIIAVTLMLSSIQAVALPMVIEFGFTNQIEDRLLAPVGMATLVAEKILAGILQGTFAALLVLPIARLTMGPVPGLALGNLGPIVLFTVLGAAVFSTLGMVLGTAIPPQQVNLLFSALLTPLISFGCAYYPWAGLAHIPALQIAVLANPLVYVAEGLRAALTPQYPHMPVAVSLAALVVISAALWLIGQRTFEKRALR